MGRDGSDWSARNLLWLEIELDPDLDDLPRRNVKVPVGRDGVPLQVAEEALCKRPHSPLLSSLHALASEVVRRLLRVDGQPEERRSLAEDLRDVRLLHEA